MPSRLIVFVAVAIVAAGCQSGAPAALSDEDVAAITTAADQWATAVLNSQDDVLGDLYAEDAMFFPSDEQPVEGREEIQSWMRTVPGLEEFRITVIDIDGRGDLAFTRTSWYGTIAGQEQELSAEGHQLLIWRKGDDGTWRISRHMLNSSTFQ